MIWRIVPYTGEFNFPFKYQQEPVHRISLIVGIEVGKKWKIVFDHLLTLFYVFLCGCIKCSHNSQQMTVLTDSGEHHQYHQYHEYHMFNLTSDWAWAASLCWSLHINEQIIKRSAEQPACHHVSRDSPPFEIRSKASADNCHDSQNIKQIWTPCLVINTEVSTDSDEPGLASAWRPCLPVCWAAQWTGQSVQTPAKCYRQTPGPAAPTNIKLNQGFCSRIKWGEVR